MQDNEERAKKFWIDHILFYLERMELKWIKCAHVFVRNLPFEWKPEDLEDRIIVEDSNEHDKAFEDRASN